MPRAHPGHLKDSHNFSEVLLLVLDVDGILTDGRLHYTSFGEQLKVFHVRDGLGIQRLQQKGVIVAIISERESAAARRRLQELGVYELHQGVGDKSLVLAQLQKKHGVGLRQTAVVGSDLPDLALFNLSGHNFAVLDAVDAVRTQAKRVLTLPGGAGAVREACDLIWAFKQSS